MAGRRQGADSKIVSVREEKKYPGGQGGGKKENKWTDGKGWVNSAP